MLYKLMFDLDFSKIIHIFAISLVPALLGIILHEVAHGWVARKCGDPTAYMLGRLTLNPIPHIDPMGLLVFGLTSLSGSYVFGWAKPVPVDPRYFKHQERDLMLVSLAGPVTNFLLAFAFGLGLFFIIHFLPVKQWENSQIFRFFVESLQAGVIINLSLGWLNLVPVPPLDGSKILAYFLPGQMGISYMNAGKYGFIILIVLLFTGILGKILGPLVRGSAIGIYTLLGF